MSMLTGQWTGTISGTNTGKFLLDITDDNGALSGHVTLNDDSNGLATFDFVGEAKDSKIQLNLAPKQFPENLDMGPLEVKGELQPDGSLSGTWEGEIGTVGTFLAFKSQAIVRPPDSDKILISETIAISHEKRCRIPSCVVDAEVLKRIYKDLSAGSDEGSRLEVAKNSPASQPQNLVQVRGWYSVVIIAKGVNGEQIISLDPSLLDEGNLPKPLSSIEFDIGAYYKISRQTGIDAPNRVHVKLDFTKPPLLDLSNPGTGPTPNDSSVIVNGNDSMWVSGIYEKLLSTLRQGRVSTGWLHSQYTYDALLWLVGLPGSLSAATLIGEKFGNRYFPNSFLPKLTLFLFILILLITIFRIGFSWVRWLLPLIEFSPLAQPIHRQIRLLLSALIIGVLGSLAASALWAAFVTP